MKMNNILLSAVLFITLVGTGLAATSTTATVHFVVPSSYDFTIAYDSNVSTATIYYVENDALVNGTMTKVQPFGDLSATIQAQGAASDQNLMSVTITGSATTDVNAYWSTGLPSGVTWKIALAQSGGGCGASVDTGYESSCSVTDADTPPTSSTCKAVSGTGVAGTKIALGLASGQVQGFCAWSDFAAVASGDASRTLNIKSGAP